MVAAALTGKKEERGNKEEREGRRASPPPSEGVDHEDWTTSLVVDSYHNSRCLAISHHRSRPAFVASCLSIR